MKATSASAPASGMALYSEARMPRPPCVPSAPAGGGLGFGDEAGIKPGIGQEERMFIRERAACATSLR